MAGDRYSLHHRGASDVAADAHNPFAHLDDHRRLVDYMENRPLMMAGTTMQVEKDALQGQAVGSIMRVAGRVLGLHLVVKEEVVTNRVPSLHKTREIRGEPRLLLIGSSPMRFTVWPLANRSRLVVFIDDQLPHRGLTQLLGQVLGRAYAAWCTWRMTIDALAAIAREVVTRDAHGNPCG